MLEHLLSFSIVRMAKVFGVSRSGLYYWVKHRHKAIQHEAIRQKLDTEVEMAQGVSKKNCLRAVITTMLKPLLPV